MAKITTEEKLEDYNNDSVIDAQDLEWKLQTRRWANRRRMAWISLLSIIVVTYLMIFVIPNDRIQVLDSVITWFYTVMGSIVGAYVGFATLEDIKKGK